MNTFRNAPELWAHTRPVAAETQPANLDDAAEVSRTLHPICPPCTGDCRQGRACTARIRSADFEREVAELDRDFSRTTNVIAGLAAAVLLCFVVVAQWPALARWLP